MLYTENVQRITIKELQLIDAKDGDKVLIYLQRSKHFKVAPCRYHVNSIL